MQNFMSDFKSQVVPYEGFLYFFVFLINIKYTILDSAVLKIIIIPSNLIFLILQKFKKFYILVMLFAKITLKCYKQEHLKARSKVKNDKFSCFKFFQFWSGTFLLIFNFHLENKYSYQKTHFQIITKINFLCKRETYSEFCNSFPYNLYKKWKLINRNSNKSNA